MATLRSDACLPVLPQPSRDVEQDGLKQKKLGNLATLRSDACLPVLLMAIAECRTGEIASFKQYCTLRSTRMSTITYLPEAQSSLRVLSSYDYLGL